MTFDELDEFTQTRLLAYWKSIYGDMPPDKTWLAAFHTQALHILMYGA